MDAFDGGDTTSDLRTLFSWSYRHLGAAAARLFRSSGLHPGPDITAPAAASLAGLALGQTCSLLAELVRAHLMIEHQPGRYTVHDLLRAYAAEQAHRHDTPDQRRMASHRMFDYYVQTACAAGRLLDPHREPIALDPPQAATVPEDIIDHDRAMAWLTAEHAVLLAAVDRTTDEGFHAHTWQLAWALQIYCYRRGHRSDCVTIHHAALNAAERRADPTMQAYSLRELAKALAWSGRYDQARVHLRQAIDRYGRLGDHLGQARAYLSLASVLALQGRLDDALRRARQALDQMRAAGHRAGEGRASNALGWFHAQRGDYQQALSYCSQAVDLQHEIGDRPGEAASWDSLGYVNHQLGHYERAITCYREALDGWNTVGHRHEAAATLDRLGDTYQAADDRAAARAAWQQALNLLADLDHEETDRVRAKLRSSPDR